MGIFIILSELVALFMFWVFGASFWKKYNGRIVKKCACESLGVASISFFLSVPLQNDLPEFVWAMHLAYNLAIIVAIICSLIAYHQMLNTMRLWLRFMGGMFLTLGIISELICLTCLCTLII